ncbi:MAG TPA: hypothetical protein VFH61_06875 [Thermoleophilia bacterium]|nr:hypothetical protein [Thermoleophilia bacterium]
MEITGSGSNSSPKFVTKSVTFTGATGLGEIGPVPIFNLTGSAHIKKITAWCETAVEGATATISLGVTGVTTLWIGATTATSLIANEFWQDATPTTTNEALSTAMIDELISTSIIVTVGTADVTAGLVHFTAEYEPTSVGGTLVAA